MPFIPHTKTDVEQMLAIIGAKNIDELFDEIPAHLQKIDLSALPEGINEMELSRQMRQKAKLDETDACFIGAGAYEHHIPAAVWEVASRGEYLTAYTPYQAEASQGTLQLLYEYQTMMASLMGLPVSNASLYDGATALTEAVLMALRAERQRQAYCIYMPKSVHPYYREVVKTIVSQQGIEIIEVPYDPQTGRMTIEILESLGLKPNVFIVPQPNFFGVIEEVDSLTEWGKQQGARIIGLVNPLSMALLKPPGQWGNSGADIACGEGQPLGVPLASGGPYYGFLCCSDSLVRQLPGRIVGRTVDKEGKPGFVLTLQAREQHIRRAKATSNICTNQGLLVTASTIYMSLMGPKGLRQVAFSCHDNTSYFQQKICKDIRFKIAFASPLFHEVVLLLPCNAEQVVARLARKRIAAGLSLISHYPELGNALLLCFTETKTYKDIDLFVEALQHEVEEH